MSGVVPAKIAAGFTQGENAVLTVIGRQCQRHGVCALHIDALAALAGCCRSTVKNALRQARLLGLIMVRERRIPGRRSLTNLVTVISPEWKGWLRLGKIGVKNLPSSEDSNKQEGKSAPLRGRLSDESGRPDRAGRGQSREERARSDLFPPEIARFTSGQPRIRKVPVQSGATRGASNSCGVK
jgi:hypothetical protein